MIQIPPPDDPLKKSMGEYPVGDNTPGSADTHARPLFGCTVSGEDILLGPSHFALPPPLDRLALLGGLTESTLENTGRVAARSILFCLIIFFVFTHASRSKRRLPPHPRRTPIIGNLSQMMDKKWLCSRECKEEFGEYREFSRRILTDEHHDHHQARSCISMSLENLPSSSTV
jgi:hypothetical protein